MYLLTKLGRAGWENIWLEVMAYGLSAFYHMTNLETNFLEVLTREAVRFCSRAVRLFPAPLKCVRPSYGTLINGFAKKALAGPYGSYDKNSYYSFIMKEMHVGNKTEKGIFCQDKKKGINPYRTESCIQ